MAFTSEFFLKKIFIDDKVKFQIVSTKLYPIKADLISSLI